MTINPFCRLAEVVCFVYVWEPFWKVQLIYKLHIVILGKTTIIYDYRIFERLRIEYKIN